MKIVKVKSLGPFAMFWRRDVPHKYFKLSKEDYSTDQSAELLPLADILDELVLVNPTHCDLCHADLPGFPPTVECEECHGLNEDRECFDQVKEVVAWWTRNPDAGI